MLMLYNIKIEICVSNVLFFAAARLIFLTTDEHDFRRIPEYQRNIMRLSYYRLKMLCMRLERSTR